MLPRLTDLLNLNPQLWWACKFRKQYHWLIHFPKGIRIKYIERCPLNYWEKHSSEEFCILLIIALFFIFNPVILRHIFFQGSLGFLLVINTFITGFLKKYLLYLDILEFYYFDFAFVSLFPCPTLRKKSSQHPQNHHHLYFWDIQWRLRFATCLKIVSLCFSLYVYTHTYVWCTHIHPYFIYSLWIIYTQIQTDVGI